MTGKSAKQIAKLLNERNHLPNKIESHNICYENYFYIVLNEKTDAEEVIAVARAKCMSFFCYELKHVVVKEKYEGKGLGKLIISLVEKYVKKKNIPMLLATTRSENTKMNGLFRKLGYESQREFVNDGTKHPLILWRKDL